jgi:hypothetical protein
MELCAQSASVHMSTHGIMCIAFFTITQKSVNMMGGLFISFSLIKPDSIVGDIHLLLSSKRFLCCI